MAKPIIYISNSLQMPLMLFGDRVKQLRENSGMTQAELGKLIGVSDRVLGYYESNERFPRKL